MAKSHPSNYCFVEDDYIDIDLAPSNFLCINARNSKEFEFESCTNSQAKDSYSTPADELFYKGNLLPLHLHPRIQTIQRLKSRHFDQLEDKYHNASNTYEFSTKKSSWCKKFKVMRNSSLCSKMKASRAYLKSLFTKSTCSDDSCEVSKFKNHGTNCIEGRIKNPIEREKVMEEENLVHRKSFSDVIKWRFTSKSNFQTSNSGSNRFYIFQKAHQPILRRSSSVNSEAESSIQGAISYCKKSFVSGRKSTSGMGYYSF